VQEFEEEALSWEDKLNRINALFDVWIDVQRRWVYLEGIFTGSADIKHLLPVETSRFQRYMLSIVVNVKVLCWAATDITQCQCQSEVVNMAKITNVIKA